MIEEQEMPAMGINYSWNEENVKIFFFNYEGWMKRQEV